MRSKHISRRDFYLVAKFVDEFFMKNSHPNLCWQQLELTISWFLRLLSLPLFDNDFFRRSHKYSFKSPADTTRVLMHLNRASDIIIMEINCSLELSDARAALKPQGLLKQLWNCSTQKVLHVKALKINHRCRYFKRHRIFYHDSQPRLGGATEKFMRQHFSCSALGSSLTSDFLSRSIYLVNWIFAPTFWVIPESSTEKLWFVSEKFSFPCSVDDEELRVESHKHKNMFSWLAVPMNSTFKVLEGSIKCRNAWLRN